MYTEYINNWRLQWLYLMQNVLILKAFLKFFKKWIKSSLKNEKKKRNEMQANGSSGTQTNSGVLRWL